MSQTAKRLRGGQPFVPTDEQRKMVRILIANGTTQATIARNIGDKGIDEKTLRKVFREELDTGYEQTEADMGYALVREGLNGNVGAQKYWLSTRVPEKWRETENRQFGFTPAADGQASTIPLLVLQPVMPSQVAAIAKPNGHAEPANHPLMVSDEEG